MWFFVPIGMPEVGIAQVFGAHIIIRLITNGKTADDWAMIKIVKTITTITELSENTSRIACYAFRLGFAPIMLGVTWLVGTIFGWPV
jgi:hypothetical protein